MATRRATNRSQRYWARWFSTALATSLQIYATTQARAQRLVESFGCLYLLCEDLTLPALRTALVVTMALPAEPPEACAAMAHQILEQQARQVDVTICEKAVRAIMKSVAKRNPDLGKHLAQEPWRVVTEHMLLQWCTGAMVGVLRADPLLVVWDRCVHDNEWLKSVVFACMIVVLELAPPLLSTETASECQAILQAGPAELSGTTLSKKLKELEQEGIGKGSKRPGVPHNSLSVTNMQLGRPA